MAGDYGARSQPFNHVQRAATSSKAAVPLDFREHHAEAVLPQGVGRDQVALAGSNSTTECGSCPGAACTSQASPAKGTVVPGCKGASARKRGSPGPWGVAQALASHCSTSAIWPGGMWVVAPARPPAAGVATAVVAVQVGVEDALQWLRAQQPLHQATVCSLWVQ